MPDPVGYSHWLVALSHEFFVTKRHNISLTLRVHRFFYFFSILRTRWLPSLNITRMYCRSTWRTATGGWPTSLWQVSWHRVFQKYLFFFFLEEINIFWTHSHRAPWISILEHIFRFLDSLWTISSHLVFHILTFIPVHEGFLWATDNYTPRYIVKADDDIQLKGTAWSINPDSVPQLLYVKQGWLFD